MLLLLLLMTPVVGRARIVRAWVEKDEGQEKVETNGTRMLYTWARPFCEESCDLGLKAKQLRRGVS